MSGVYVYVRVYNGTPVTMSYIFSFRGHFVLNIRLKIYWHVYIDILKVLCFHSVITPTCIYTLLNFRFHNIQ